MASNRIAKIKIDREKLKDIIKNSGHTIKGLAEEINWSDRSIRNAITSGWITEDLLVTLSEVLDYDLAQIRCTPEPVSKNVKTRENIKALADLFGDSLEDLAKKIMVPEKELKDAINNKIPITRVLLDKLSEYFDLSVEMIINGDFSDSELSFDPTSFNKNINALLPVVTSDEAEKNPVFAKAYESHLKLFEAAKSFEMLSAEEAETAFNECINCYDDVDSGEYTEEAWVNALSFYFYVLISVKGIERAARYVHHQKQYPAMVQKIKETNPELKAMIESLENSDELEDDTPFQDMIKDPEFHQEINRLMRHLKRNPDWADLADYYVCLQYVFAAVDNDFSDQLNQEFGIELMLKFRSLRNKYAKTYVSVIEK